MFKLNKYQLDLLGTVFGLIAGLSGVLVVQEVGDRKVVGTVGGFATVLLGIVTQRPADSSPTTEDLEEKRE